MRPNTKHTKKSPFFTSLNQKNIKIHQKYQNFTLTFHQSIEQDQNFTTNRFTPDEPTKKTQNPK